MMMMSACKDQVLQSHIYNRLFTPLTHLNKYMNMLKTDTSDGKINCY